LRILRGIVTTRGWQDIVYVDESGFESSSYQPWGWALKGVRVYTQRSGQTRPRTGLIAARRGKQWLAPMLFNGTANTALVNAWFEKMMLKELRPNSTIIWDNARFHNPKDLQPIASNGGHTILFLPPYSPDLNPIEHDFATRKRQRQNATPETPIQNIIKMYKNYRS
jgi:putative transposase